MSETLNYLHSSMLMTENSDDQHLWSRICFFLLLAERELGRVYFILQDTDLDEYICILGSLGNEGDMDCGPYTGPDF